MVVVYIRPRRYCSPQSPESRYNILYVYKMGINSKTVVLSGFYFENLRVEFNGIYLYSIYIFPFSNV